MYISPSLLVDDGRALGVLLMVPWFGRMHFPFFFHEI